MDPATDWVSSRYGGALDFDGLNDYVDLGSDAANITGTGITIVTIEKRVVGSDYYVQVARNGPTGGTGAQLQYQTYGAPSGDFVFNFGDTTDTLRSHTASVRPTLGALHHLAVTYDGVAVRSYQDGVGTGSTAHTESIGAKSGALTRFMTDAPRGTSYGGGVLYDVKIYDRGLSAGEIAWLYARPFDLYRTPEPVLAGTPAAGFFEFDQLTGGMPDLRGGMV
jgi:hypothetical protein